MKCIFDVSLDDKKLTWPKPESHLSKKTPYPLDVHETYDTEAADSDTGTCSVRIDRLRQHATNNVAICATLVVLVMLQLLFLHYDVQIIASTYSIVLCPLFLAVYVHTGTTQAHVLLLHYISVYVMLAHYEQRRDTSWLLSCWGIAVFAHLALIHLRNDRKNAKQQKASCKPSFAPTPHAATLHTLHTSRAVLAAFIGLVVVNCISLVLRLFLFARHTSEHTNTAFGPRHVSHLAHGALLLLNAAAYACLRP